MVGMIGAYAPVLLGAAVALNGCWLLGSWLVTRSSARRWVYRGAACVLVGVQVAWVARVLHVEPMPTHTLRLGELAVNLDFAGLVWHAVILPLGLAAMALRGAVVVVRGRVARRIRVRGERAGAV